MKNSKFLFVAVILTCFVGVTQTNAQANILEGSAIKEVSYEAANGVPVEAVAVGYAHLVLTPSGNFLWVFQGLLPEGTPLPKKTVIYYTPVGPVGTFDDYEKVTITPSGKVTVVATL